MTLVPHPACPSADSAEEEEARGNKLPRLRAPAEARLAFSACSSLFALGPGRDGLLNEPDRSLARALSKGAEVKVDNADVESDLGAVLTGI